MEPVIDCPLVVNHHSRATKPSLVLMSFVKLGDFILATPSLQKVQEIEPELLIAVPDSLWGLYSKYHIFKSAIPMSQVECVQHKSLRPVKILNLTFPLLNDIDVPAEHLRLSSEVFKLPQHASKSYAQSLKEYFPGMNINFHSKPFLDLDPDPTILNHFGAQPFQYFTLHSGSDFPYKNWSALNFEKTASLILESHTHLKCLCLVGPQDDVLFQTAPVPDRFLQVRTDLESAAHLLAGSLFHIDNDSGIHHLAGALDVPSITVFGPTPPGTWCSLTDRNFIHWGAPNCPKPCGGAEILTCENKICLSSVLPEHLLQSAEHIMSYYCDFPK